MEVNVYQSVFSIKFAKLEFLLNALGHLNSLVCIIIIQSADVCTYAHAHMHTRTHTQSFFYTQKIAAHFKTF